MDNKNCLAVQKQTQCTKYIATREITRHTERKRKRERGAEREVQRKKAPAERTSVPPTFFFVWGLPPPIKEDASQTVLGRRADEAPFPNKLHVAFSVTLAHIVRLLAALYGVEGSACLPSPPKRRFHHVETYRGFFSQEMTP